jgi:DNA-binding NtrC family response regulator
MIVGRDARLMAAVERARLLARTDLPLLLVGETGTGKELVAREVHRASGLRPFIPVNCAAVPRELFESELFGHEKGAFTGADRTRTGLWKAAEGGTLFLDEIGDVPRVIQPKLLRALDQGEVRAVGSNRLEPSQVRVVAATSKDLRRGADEGWFGRDLYYRLAGGLIRLPPLRERGEDTRLLAEHFADGCDGSPRLSAEALELIVAHAWPGNVRELKYAVASAAAICEHGVISPRDLPEELRGGVLAGPGTGGRPGRFPTLDEVLQGTAARALERSGGNISRAARLLEIDRRRLRRMMRKYGLGGP